MENPSSRSPASFKTQADALFRKNWTFQKRKKMANCQLLLPPILMCALFAFANYKMRMDPKDEKNQPFPPGYMCSAAGQMDEEIRCSIPSPPENPLLLQIPEPENRAVRTNLTSFGDLPDGSCRRTKSCPATILVTGMNKSLGLDLAANFFSTSTVPNSSDMLIGLADGVYGSIIQPLTTMFVDPALVYPDPIINLRTRCGRKTRNSSISFPMGSEGIEKEIKCVKGLSLWRNSSSEINEQIFKGHWNKAGVNEIVAAYDFLNSNNKDLNVSIWYNSTTEVDEDEDSSEGGITMTRVPRLVNLVSNAYLKFVRGPDFKILFEFVKEMPKHPASKPLFDASIDFGPILFTWVILELFPIMLANLVYEKQENIRLMMKMHGLGDGPYWVISYVYFVVISSTYVFFLVATGSAIGLKFFTAHNYGLQFVFYFVYLNLQITFSFLVSGLFSKETNASVVAHLVVIVTGLTARFGFQNMVDDTTFPRVWVGVMELFPGFALFRMCYEFSIKAKDESIGQTSGMIWQDLNDRSNGMKELLLIMVAEWFVFLFVLYCIEKKVSIFCDRMNPSSSQRISLRDFDQVEKADVALEREKVDELLLEDVLRRPNRSYSIICDNLKKVYPGKDGNPAKVAVNGLSLALPRGECFGMLGPNGAGKSSFIKMMIGLTKPSSGTAFVEGLNIETDMERVYTSMGVCPQHDLLWESLTAREHLLFYGRLKNLKGSALNQAVEESLKSVNLLNGGVADKQAGKYSGGMKRRLSVAIALIGDPKVVYMDEPSTGLDPASRNQLWNVVMRAKRNRVIILTTHSMEEAEHLCERLGIFVDGSLQCIGNAKQIPLWVLSQIGHDQFWLFPQSLKARYGGFYVFTITTSVDNEQEMESMVRHLCPSANKTYQISGTQKFELPKNEVRIADVYGIVMAAKTKFPIQAWGLADTTLEDVFIKVARGAEAFQST